MFIVAYIKNYPSPKSKKSSKFVVFWKNLPNARHKKTILKRLILNYFWPTNLFGPKLHKNICFETKKYNRTSGIKNTLIFFRLLLKFLTEFRQDLTKIKNCENPENPFFPKESWYLSLMRRQNIVRYNTFIYGPFGEPYETKVFADKRHIFDFGQNFRN